jgi:hypothetical protein
MWYFHQPWTLCQEPQENNMQRTSWNSIIICYSLFWLGMEQCLTVTLKLLHRYRLQQGNTSAAFHTSWMHWRDPIIEELVKDNIRKQDGKKVENLVNYKVANMSLRLTEKVNVTLFLCTPWGQTGGAVHPFLTSALDGSKCAISHCDCFSLVKEPPLPTE